MVKLLYSLYCKWVDVKVKTRSMAFITLAFSLFISSLTFWVLASVQEDSILTDTRFSKDLSLLLASNVISLAERKDYEELSCLVEQIYLSTSSIRYILFFNTQGEIYYSLPEYLSDFSTLCTCDSKLLTYDISNHLFFTPLVSYSFLFKDQVTDICIPLIKDGINLGSVNLGINPNPSILFTSQLIQYVIVSAFLSIWLVTLISLVFNATIMTVPVDELLSGILAIASGNFSYRINFSFEGNIGYLVSSFNNMAEKLEIYEQKNIEQLVLEKSKLETLISIIADGAILLDRDLRVVFINQSASKILQFFDLSLVGTYIYDHLPTHVNRQVLPVLNQMVKMACIDHNISTTKSLYISLDDKTPKILKFVVTTVLDQDQGLLNGVALIIQDMTKEIELQEATTHFITNVSHELRTPLFNIGSFLETLVEYNSSLSHQQKKEFLDIAFQETKRLISLVNDVLDLSRLESNFQYSLENIYLSDVILTVIQASQIRATNKQVILDFKTSSMLLRVKGYQSLLLQVLSNLLDNALKFTGQGGRIVIKVYNCNICEELTNLSFRVRVQVVDEGIGINILDQLRVFDRFVRIENNVHILEGTGLGLSIVKNIVQKHNSEICLYSESGIGSSFWFDLILLEKKS